MKRLNAWYSNLNFKERIRLSYFFLIIAPVTILSVLFFQVAAKSILEIAKNNLHDIVTKDVALIDDKLAEIERKVYYCNVDPIVLNVLQGLQDAPMSQMLQRDREFKQLMYQKFDEASIVSANLITDRYVFGDNSEAIIPKEAFYHSNIYTKDLRGENSVVWIPSYTVKSVFDAEFITEDEKFFSIVYSLRPTDISQGGIINDQNLIDGLKPVMMVNIPWNSVERPFASGHKETGEFYSISTARGQIISHTEDDLVSTRVNFPWLDKIGNKTSGSMQLTYQGQPVIVSYAVSKVTGWIAARIVPVSSLLKKVDLVQKIAWVCWGLMLFFGVIASEFLSRRVTRPVNRLVAAMADSGRGEFTKIVTVEGKDELHYLTRKFNQMNEEIRELIKQNYESEIQNKEAQIQALNLQMNPHFLYNTLNIINLSAIEEENYEISSMILALSDMLQYTFRNKRELVVFSDEIEWLKNYLMIMQLRFEDKFTVHYQIDPRLDQCRIPKLLLQQFVENALQHGFAQMTSGGLLEIKGALIGEQVQLIIKDNGQGITENRLREVLAKNSRRVGINNGIRRLDLLFGEAASIKIDSKEGIGTTVTITFPYKT